MLQFNYRDLAVNVLLTVGSCLTCMLLSELALRGVYLLTYRGSVAELRSKGPARGANLQSGMMIRPDPDANIVYSMYPEMEVQFTGFTNRPLPPTTVRTNSQGWRGAEFPPAEKGPGDCRIVAIGDSFLFGWGVEEPQRYSQVLETMLNESFPACRWSVLAFAAPGYNLVQETAVLTRDGLKYHPDIIVYHYVANDSCLPSFLFPPARPLAAESFIALYVAKLASHGDLNSAWWIPSISLSLDPLGRSYHQICEEESAPAEYRHLAGGRNMQQAYLELRATAEAISAPLVIVSHDTLPEEAWCRHKNVYCAGLGTPLNDAATARGFTSFRDSDLVHNRSDVHFSVKGNALFAKLLLDALDKRRLPQRVLDSRGLDRPGLPNAAQ